MIRDILKKAAVALMAVSVIGGAMVVENSTVAKAEDEAYTVNFHVKDDGQDFSQLTIKAYTTSNQGKDEAFEKKDGEGFYKFNFFRDPEDDVDNEISFVVQRDDGLKVSVLQDSYSCIPGRGTHYEGQHCDPPPGGWSRFPLQMRRKRAPHPAFPTRFHTGYRGSEASLPPF